MSGAGWFALGALAATIVVTRIKPANTSNCCARVNYGVRDKISEQAGPFSGFVSDVLDGLGLTNHLSGVLDSFGVPLDA